MGVWELSDEQRHLIWHLLEIWEDNDRVPVSSVSLAFAMQLDEDEVIALMDELEGSHATNAGAPHFWFPDIDRCLRDRLAPGESTPALPAHEPQPRGRLSELAERTRA